MNPSKPCYRSAKDRPKMINLEKEIFLDSEDLVDMFTSEVNQSHVWSKIREMDYDLLVVVRKIQNLIESLDTLKNEEEITFWKSQTAKLKDDVKCHRRIHSESWRKDREHVERARQEALVLIRDAGLDWEGYKKMKDDPNEIEVSEVNESDNENVNKVETEETTLLEKDESKFVTMLDDDNAIVTSEERKLETGFISEMKVDNDETVDCQNDKEEDDNPGLFEDLVENLTHETSDKRIGKLVDISEAIMADIENCELAEDLALDLKILETFDMNMLQSNDDQKKEVVHANTENVEEKESFATKAVEEFANQMHIKNDEFEIPGQDLISFDIILCEEAEEYDGKEFVNAKVDRNNEEGMRNENEAIVIDVDNDKELDVDVLDISKDSTMLVEMNTEVYVEDFKGLFTGTFLENSEAINAYLKKFTEIEVENKDIIQHDAFVSSPEEHVENSSVQYILEEDMDNKNVIHVEVDEDQAKKPVDIKLLFEGTFLENLKEILENLDKCKEDANEQEGNFSSSENQIRVEYSALETLAEVLDEKDSKEDILQGGKAVKEFNDLRDDCLNDEVCAEADNAQEMMKIDMNLLQVLNLLLLLAVLTVWFILIPIVRLVGIILINLQMCVPSMLDIYQEYDTEVVETVTKEASDEHEEAAKDTAMNIMSRSAKVTKTGVCKFCCCHLQCHGRIVTLDKNKELSKRFLPNLMEKSWLEQYVVGMPVAQEKLVFLLFVTNMDLKEALLEDQTASADTFMV